MSWRWVALVAFWLAGSGSPAAAGDKQPPYRCFLEGKADALPRVEATGISGLDKRLRAERSFLEVVFRVKPKLVLLGDGAPRDACVYATPDGQPAVGLKASWLKARCWERPHRNALVAAALAHQYTHVLQADHGCTLPEMARELHADLLAGWFLGKRNFGTLAGGKQLDAAFAASLFDAEDPYLNTRCEHGAPEARVPAVSEGFRLRRAERLSLPRIFGKGIEMFPPPEVGYQGARPEDLAGTESMRFRRAKLACIHQGPCRDHVACQHPTPCVHKVGCSHLQACVHRTTCTHRVECRHRTPCAHRTDCRHKADCVHTTPCVHPEHASDPDHEYDLDAYGNRVRCIHPGPCRHFRHRFDFLHNFDAKHDFDYRHDHDKQHDFDDEHEYDTDHVGDPIHEFDLAHGSDPKHEFDLAHDADPLHDYDISMQPAEQPEK